MDVKKPLDVIGWLGSSGYRMVVDEARKIAAEEAKNESAPTPGKVAEVKNPENKQSDPSP